MATQVRMKAKDLYDEDFYVWTEAQAALLRERRFEALDLANLIEEVEGLDDAKKSAVLNNASVIRKHLLKLQHSPARDPRRGRSELIIGHRARLEIELTPRLRRILEEELPRVYALTRRTTERKVRLYGEDAAAEARRRQSAPTRSSRSPATGGRRLAGDGGTPGQVTLFAGQLHCLALL